MLVDFYFFTSGFLCFKDSDCPDNLCQPPSKQMCYFVQCVCGVDTIV